MTVAQTNDFKIPKTPLAVRFSPSAVVPWFVIILTIGLVLLPLVPIGYQALLDRPLYDAGGKLTLKNLSDLFFDARFHAAVGNSLLFAVGATLIAQLMGVTAAVLVGRTNIAGKSLIIALVVWPMLVSDLVKALGWSIMYGPAGYVTQFASLNLGLPAWNLNSLGGMMIVGGISHAPLAYLFCIGAVRAMDPAIEDAARTAGASRRTVLFRIALPLLRPALIGSTFFNFIMCLETLSIPLIFGKPSGIMLFTTYIYMNSVQAVTQNYGIVAASSFLLLAVLLITVKLQRKMLGDTRRFITVGSKAGRQKDFELGAFRWPVSIATLSVMIAAVGIPLLGVLLQAFAEFFSPLIPYAEVATLDNFRYLWSRPIYTRALVNSLIISSVGAAVGVVLVFMIAAIVTRTRNKAGPALEAFAMLPRAVPGMIAGLGFFYAAVLFPPLGWTRGTLVILIIAFIMRYLPLGLGTLMPSMMQVSADLEHSARTSGASWLKTMFHILLPILKPSLLAAYTVLFLQFFKDYATAVFLYSPGTEILGTVMLLLVWDGHTGAVAALATVQVLLTFAFIVTVGRLSKFKLYD